ncbi:MAG: type II toxin-antitoxin system HicB family antitoxin [Patescibacteria group bacterium]
MKIYKFTAIFTPEKGAKDVYNVSVPALPGCLTFGESLVEAKYNIRDAMELYLENMLDDGETIPKDKKTRVPKNALTEEVVVGVNYEVKTGFDNFKTELQYA